jgi:hypothetical protein
VISKSHNSRQPKSKAASSIAAPPGYEQHQGEIALRMNHFLMRYLNAIYQEFDGDLALVIVLGEIAHHNVSRLYSSQGPLPPSGATNYDAPDLQPISNRATLFRWLRPPVFRAKPFAEKWISW